MIQEVIKLGIKGSDIVIGQLNKIQAEKKKTAKAVDVRVAMSRKVQDARTGRELAERQAPGGGAKKDTDAVKTGLDAAQGALGAVSSQNANALAGSVASSIGALFGPYGAIVGGFVGPLLEMGRNFSNNVRRATETTGEFAKALAGISHYTERTEKQTPDSGRFRFQRNDMTAEKTAQFITSVGKQVGRFSEEYKAALSKLVGTEKDRFDIDQSQQMAAGNFSALGTDKGFFLQKIASGFEGMPPSIKQKLLAQLYDQVSPEDRFQQVNRESLGTAAAFKGQDIDIAYKQATGSDVRTALEEQRTQGGRDAAMTQATGDLVRATDMMIKWLSTIEGGTRAKPPGGLKFEGGRWQ